MEGNKKRADGEPGCEAYEGSNTHGGKFDSPTTDSIHPGEESRMTSTVNKFEPKKKPLINRRKKLRAVDTDLKANSATKLKAKATEVNAIEGVVGLETDGMVLQSKRDGKGVSKSETIGTALCAPYFNMGLPSYGGFGYPYTAMPMMWPSTVPGPVNMSDGLVKETAAGNTPFWPVMHPGVGAVTSPGMNQAQGFHPMHGIPSLPFAGMAPSWVLGPGATTYPFQYNAQSQESITRNEFLKSVEGRATLEVDNSASDGGCKRKALQVAGICSESTQQVKRSCDGTHQSKRNDDNTCSMSAVESDSRLSEDMRAGSTESMGGKANVGNDRLEADAKNCQMQMNILYQTELCRLVKLLLRMAPDQNTRLTMEEVYDLDRKVEEQYQKEYGRKLRLCKPGLIYLRQSSVTRSQIERLGLLQTGVPEEKWENLKRVHDYCRQIELR